MDFLTLPTFMTRQILDFLNYQTYTVLRPTCKRFAALWTQAMETGRMTGVLFLPKQCAKLEDAVETVEKDDRLTTIVLGQGEHLIDSTYLNIYSAMHIVGDPGVAKEEIVVVGGISFEKGIQRNCHLQHLTLRQGKGNGVQGWSSFTMEDVLVEQCGRSGVVASGAYTRVVGRCTNVEVRQCGRSGVLAHNGASITLIGAKTTVHHNCTRENSNNYGLDVSGCQPSTIQLVSPLTKKQVAIDNGGGGNWGADGGADHQIKTIEVDHLPNNCCICC
jgi:hypothetical protein